MTPKAAEPIPVLDYRTNQPLPLLRDPMDPITPFPLGTAIAAGIGIVPTALLGYYGLRTTPMHLFAAASLTFVFAWVTCAVSLGLFLVLRRKLSRNILTALPDNTCFICGLSFGAIIWPGALYAGRLWNLEFEELALFLFASPAIGALGAAMFLVRRVRIRESRPQ